MGFATEPRTEPALGKCLHQEKTSGWQRKVTVVCSRFPNWTSLHAGICPRRGGGLQSVDKHGMELFIDGEGVRRAVGSEAVVGGNVLVHPHPALKSLQRLSLAAIPGNPECSLLPARTRPHLGQSPREQGCSMGCLGRGQGGCLFWKHLPSAGLPFRLLDPGSVTGRRGCPGVCKHLGQCEVTGGSELLSIKMFREPCKTDEKCSADTMSLTSKGRDVAGL